MLWLIFLGLPALIVIGWGVYQVFDGLRDIGAIWHDRNIRD